MEDFRRVFMEALDKIKVIYTVLNEEDNLIHIGYTTEIGTNLDVFADFDENSKGEQMPSCKFVIPRLVVAPEDKSINVLLALNDLNETYRFVKFSLNANNYVTLTFDSFFLGGDAVTECMFALQTLLKVANEAYPVVMRAIYS